MPPPDKTQTYPSSSSVSRNDLIPEAFVAFVLLAFSCALREVEEEGLLGGGGLGGRKGNTEARNGRPKGYPCESHSPLGLCADGEPFGPHFGGLAGV